MLDQRCFLAVAETARQTLPDHVYRKLGDGVALARDAVTLGRLDVDVLGRLIRGFGGRELGRVALVDRLVVVLAGDRILELAHPLAERAAHLGEALRPEEDEEDDQEDDHLGDADSEWHGLDSTIVCPTSSPGTQAG